MINSHIGGFSILIKWLSVNTHLVPSFVSFIFGLILLIIAPIKYHIRTGTLIILNPIKAFREYDKFEKTCLVAGAAFTFIGLLSEIIIAKTIGYYYFKNGIPTSIRGRV